MVRQRYYFRQLEYPESAVHDSGRNRPGHRQYLAQEHHGTFQHDGVQPALTVWVSCKSPPREEGWMRHQENFGEAHLSAADGVVAHKANCGVSDHPGRCRGHPSSRGGECAYLTSLAI